jgi:hypothetical protein
MAGTNNAIPLHSSFATRFKTLTNYTITTHVYATQVRKRENNTSKEDRCEFDPQAVIVRILPLTDISVWCSFVPFVQRTADSRIFTINVGREAQQLHYQPLWLKQHKGIHCRVVSMAANAYAYLSVNVQANRPGWKMLSGTVAYEVATFANLPASTW